MFKMQSVIFESNNKDCYYLKDNAKDLETPCDYEVKTSPPIDDANSSSQNRD